MTYDETGSCLSDPDAQISIQQSIRDAVTNIQHVPNTCPTEHARPHFEEQSLGVCLQEASRRAPGSCNSALRSSEPLPRPARAAMSRITWAESTPRSQTPPSLVRSQRSHCPKRYWIAPEEPCTTYQSLCSTSPRLNTPSLTSIKATCFSPASCGDSDVAT